MGILSIVRDSIGCSASGERLVMAAREGDLEETKALLEYNPRLARYSTFGVRSAPLHHSASHGHHEVVSVLVESGANINLRNSSGQTPLMLACLHGHWEVVQILMLFKANIHKKDYLSGATALHFAALNGHTRCIRLLLVDYIPSIPDYWSVMRGRFAKKDSLPCFDDTDLCKVVNGRADGGITSLHLSALNGHPESVQLLLDLGASVSEVTVNDGATIDLIGPGSTPLHYAACGGNAVCCQVLIARGATLTAKNDNGWTPLMVARSWHKNWLESILRTETEGQIAVLPSKYLSLPLMSIVKIAREYGWRNVKHGSTCGDPCAICLESKCTVAAEGCHHEFCTNCALYLSSTDNTSKVQGPPGSIPCPLCRHTIVSFIKLPDANMMKKALVTASSSASLFTACSMMTSKPETKNDTRATKPDIKYKRSKQHSVSITQFS